jgi:6-pyruvoyltetrahydropterin/6-carboxytetrahydropterin synthase
MLIEKTIEIDMGHRVPNHKSKCSNIHGHRYKIEVGVDDKVINTPGDSSEGMVIDFGDLKKVMMEEIDSKFDHGFICYKEDKQIAWAFSQFRDGYDCSGRVDEEKGPFNQMKIIFVPFIPTAENLAKHWYELMKTELEKVDIKIKHVKVWETPTSTATYEE